MHDPKTVAWEIRYPWRKYRPWPKGVKVWDEMTPEQWKNRSSWWRNGYRETFITLWHNDPETDHTDDSCGWFMRARHGDKEVLEKIVKRFSEDWDRTYTSDPEEGGDGTVYFCGYFAPEASGSGMPNMSVTAIVLNLFFLAACEHFHVDGHTSWKKARRFMQKNLFDIMLFSENPTDSLRDEIVRKWGTEKKREERIRNVACCVYAWILRCTRPWWKHPRYHVRHLSVQCHPWQTFRRWLLSRCSKCGGRFKYGEVPVSGQWDTRKPKFMCGETDIMHHGCCGMVDSAKKGTP